MRITEVRVKIMEDRGDKLQAFCTITLDDSFVIRDLKIIGGAKGIFVAMPSRKLSDRCQRCGCKNHLRAAYCNECGARLVPDRAARDDHGRAKLHADIAHPINSSTREALQRAVIEAFQAEVERSKLPGYVAPKIFDDFDDYAAEYEDQDPSMTAANRGVAGPPTSVSGRMGSAGEAQRAVRGVQARPVGGQAGGREVRGAEAPSASGLALETPPPVSPRVAGDFSTGH